MGREGWLCRQNLGRSNGGGDQRTSFSPDMIANQPSKCTQYKMNIDNTKFCFHILADTSFIQNWHYSYGISIIQEIIIFFGGCCWTKSEAGLVGKYGSSLGLLPLPGQQQQQPGMSGMFTSPLFVTSITPLLLPSRSPPSRTLPKI